jgi:hypothetical protein
MVANTLALKRDKSHLGVHVAYRRLTVISRAIFGVWLP